MLLYNNVLEGIFRRRPNRFIAYVDIDGKTEKVHVKNTGRCKELLVPGCTVYLDKSDNPNRKTAYDLVAVMKGDTLINMDSAAPNKVFGQWAKENYPGAIIKPEVKYENSRFDFYIEQGDRKIFTEVKGVTLEENGIVKFPDAPTERGLKHIHELKRVRSSDIFCCANRKCKVIYSKLRHTSAIWRGTETCKGKRRKNTCLQL